MTKSNQFKAPINRVSSGNRAKLPTGKSSSSNNISMGGAKAVNKDTNRNSQLPTQHQRSSSQSNSLFNDIIKIRQEQKFLPYKVSAKKKFQAHFQNPQSKASNSSSNPPNQDLNIPKSKETTSNLMILNQNSIEKTYMSQLKNQKNPHITKNSNLSLKQATLAYSNKKAPKSCNRSQTPQNQIINPFQQSLFSSQFNKDFEKNSQIESKGADERKPIRSSRKQLSSLQNTGRQTIRNLSKSRAGSLNEEINDKLQKCQNKQTQSFPEQQKVIQRLQKTGSNKRITIKDKVESAQANSSRNTQQAFQFKVKTNKNCAGSRLLDSYSQNRDTNNAVKESNSVTNRGNNLLNSIIDKNAKSKRLSCYNIPLKIKQNENNQKFAKRLEIKIEETISSKNENGQKQLSAKNPRLRIKLDKDKKVQEQRKQSQESQNKEDNKSLLKNQFKKLNRPQSSGSYVSLEDQGVIGCLRKSFSNFEKFNHVKKIHIRPVLQQQQPTQNKDNNSKPKPLFKVVVKKPSNDANDIKPSVDPPNEFNKVAIKAPDESQKKQSSQPKKDLRQEQSPSNNQNCEPKEEQNEDIEHNLNNQGHKGSQVQDPPGQDQNLVSDPESGDENGDNQDLFKYFDQQKHYLKEFLVTREKNRTTQLEKLEIQEIKPNIAKHKKINKTLKEIVKNQERNLNSDLDVVNNNKNESDNISENKLKESQNKQNENNDQYDNTKAIMNFKEQFDNIQKTLQKCLEVEKQSQSNINSTAKTPQVDQEKMKDISGGSLEVSPLTFLTNEYTQGLNCHKQSEHRFSITSNVTNIKNQNDKESNKIPDIGQEMKKDQKKNKQQLENYVLKKVNEDCFSDTNIYSDGDFDQYNLNSSKQNNCKDQNSSKDIDQTHTKKSNQDQPLQSQNIQIKDKKIFQYNLKLNSKLDGIPSKSNSMAQQYATFGNDYHDMNTNPNQETIQLESLGSAKNQSQNKQELSIPRSALDKKFQDLQNTIKRSQESYQDESYIVSTQQKRPNLNQAIQGSITSQPRSYASQSSARQKEASSSQINEKPYLMTFNEDGQNFIQEQIFDVHKNSSQILNSTQTFKKKSDGMKEQNCFQGCEQSELPSPSLNFGSLSRGDSLTAIGAALVNMNNEYSNDKIQESKAMIQNDLNSNKQQQVNQESNQKLNQNCLQQQTEMSKNNELQQIRNNQETKFDLNAIQQKLEYDCDPIVNDADLEVYEDDDFEDSADEAEDDRHQFLSSGQHLQHDPSSNGINQGKREKLSGYKLIKQIEESRNTCPIRNQLSSNNTRNNTHRPHHDQGTDGVVGANKNIDSTLLSQNSLQVNKITQQTSMENSTRSLGKSKSSDQLLSNNHGKDQLELKQFIDEQFNEEKQSLSNKKDKEEQIQSQFQNPTHFTEADNQNIQGLQGYLNESIRLQPNHNQRQHQVKHNGSHILSSEASPYSQNQQHQLQQKQNMQHGPQNGYNNEQQNHNNYNYTQTFQNAHNLNWYGEQQRQTFTSMNSLRQPDQVVQSQNSNLSLNQDNHTGVSNYNNQEYVQQFKIGNYGKKEDGMAPSLKQQKQLIPQQRQRPSSQIIFNNRNDLNFSESEDPLHDKFEQNQFIIRRNAPSSAQQANRQASSAQNYQYQQKPMQGTQGATDTRRNVIPLPKRRKIRPISSLCAKKANLPSCFLEDPSKYNNNNLSAQNNVGSKRVLSAQLKQSNNNGCKIGNDTSLNADLIIKTDQQFTEKNYSVTPPTQNVKFDNFNNNQQNIDQNSIINQVKKAQFTRPESSYGQKGRNQSAKQHFNTDNECDKHSEKQAQLMSNDFQNQQPSKVEVLELTGKEFKKVFATPKQISAKGNPNAMKPPRIQSGQIYSKQLAANQNNSHCRNGQFQSYQNNPHPRQISSALPSRSWQQQNNRINNDLYQFPQQLPSEIHHNQEDGGQFGQQLKSKQANLQQ